MPSILVVDDEDQIRQLMGETLEQAGYRVTEARDGKEPSSSIGWLRPTWSLWTFSCPIKMVWRLPPRCDGNFRT